MKNVKKVMIALMPFAIAIGGAAASGLGTPRLNTQAEYRQANNPENQCEAGITEQENCSPMNTNAQCTILGSGELAFVQGTACSVELKRP